MLAWWSSALVAAVAAVAAVAVNPCAPNWSPNAPEQARTPLLFKWIKQHRRIKRFQGHSEGAAKAQVWCAITNCVRIDIGTKELHLKASLYTRVPILSVSVFEKTEGSCALQPDCRPLPSDLSLESSSRRRR